MTERRIRIGLLLNPVAGMGGPTGLKGTDGVIDEAIRRGGESRVDERVELCLNSLVDTDIEWLTLPAAMGADLLARLGLPHKVTGRVQEGRTTAEDTRRGVVSLEGEGIDLLLFAGGDGTARDIVDSYHDCSAILGVPCGVKMHSGVFATSPQAAAGLINKLSVGELLSVIQAEVRDIDEASFREGIVKTQFYGELPVPDDLRFMQQTKVGGREVEELVIEEIAAEFIENLDPETLYIMGSGSTIAGVMAAMGLPSTLLGIDVIKNREIVATDVSEQQLLKLLQKDLPARIVVTAISGQGHIFGRGNQQLSPVVIRKVGVNNIDILASKSKLAGLNKRPLLVDTGDMALDESLRGIRSIVTGYEDRVLYRIG
ncbi:MAG: ATP-NAD kinase family protein [Gammaproteobacteria bacterium]|mgnify:CR=1 FL=1|jgi:predicted polyphosphate/ATP-dependent NAD kinase|nr:ATP-NAD kinase family protein [Gammaproteobacteria bacterium]MBT4493544.1 ATP-NAD kinase family protein [Gammaproteobacteria bacterium]MBT7370994.1 ATP-NAD kinase family protein [Gammaproteobacteria bacterium]